MAGTWYSTGTASVTNGSANIVGTSTLWSTAVFQGDMFAAQASNGVTKFYEILTVTDDTHIVLTAPFEETTNATLSYFILPWSPFRGSITAFATYYSQVVTQWRSILSLTGNNRVITLNEASTSANAGTLFQANSVNYWQQGMFANGGSAHPDWSVQWWNGSSWADALGISQSNGVAYAKIAPAAGDASTNLATTAWVGQNRLGGFLNKFRNPSMDIHQRGTTGTLTAGTPAYTVDGWIVTATGVNTSWSWSNIAGFAAGGSFLAPALHILCASGLTGLTVKQRIESFIAAQLQEQGNAPVTVQFAIWNDTAGTITPTLKIDYPTVPDTFSSVTAEANANGVSMQSLAAGNVGTFAYTFLPTSHASMVNGCEAIFNFGGSLNAASGDVYISICDIRATPGVASGINNNPPPPELRPIGIEMPSNQRYFESKVGNPAGVDFISASYGASNEWASWPFHQPKRATPTFALLNSPTWTGVTPTISPGIDEVRFFNNGSNTEFYLATTGGTICCSASAEL